MDRGGGGVRAKLRGHGVQRAAERDAQAGGATLGAVRQLCAVGPPALSSPLVPWPASSCQNPKPASTQAHPSPSANRCVSLPAQPLGEV